MFLIKRVSLKICCLNLFIFIQLIQHCLNIFVQFFTLLFSHLLSQNKHFFPRRNLNLSTIIGQSLSRISNKIRPFAFVVLIVNQQLLAVATKLVIYFSSSNIVAVLSGSSNNSSSKSSSKNYSTNLSRYVLIVYCCSINVQGGGDTCHSLLYFGHFTLTLLLLWNCCRL